MLPLMLLAYVWNSAGSGVSELLDERLRKLKLELEESEKACQALLPSVEAFTKGTREVGVCFGGKRIFRSGHRTGEWAGFTYTGRFVTKGEE